MNTKNCLGLFILLLVSGGDVVWSESFRDRRVTGVGCVDNILGDFGVPLLSGFKLDFDRDDHHIRKIIVQTVLSNTNQLDKVCVRYSDKIGDDMFSFDVKYRGVSDLTNTRLVASGSSNGGHSTHRLRPRDGFTFVLTGFRFSFETPSIFVPGRSDHHLGTLSIRPNDSQTLLTVRYADKNADDNFDWSVSYAWVPNDLIESTGRLIDSGVKRSSTKEIPSNGTAVIRGFTLTFGNLAAHPSQEDHHIDEIGVYINGEAPPSIKVYFNDKNDDDTFDWLVDYAVLPRTPELSFSPKSLSFGSVPLRGIRTRVLTIENTLATSVTVSFSGSSTGPITWKAFNQTIANGEKKAVRFDFRPTSQGFVQRTLRINSSAPGSPHTIRLSGSGRGIPGGREK